MKLIAECAINYNSMDEAKEMIRECKRLGLFAAKFQLYNEEGLDQLTDLTVREYCRERMLSLEDAKELFEYGKSINQIVFFTPMYDCIAELEEIGVNYYKIRHYDNKNWGLQIPIVKTMKPTFISLGVDHFDFIMSGSVNYIPLFCVPDYPAHEYDYIEMSIITFQGCSDHTPNLELFKCYYEKIPLVDFYWERHVCLDRNKETCLEKEWVSSFSELEEVLK